MNARWLQANPPVMDLREAENLPGVLSWKNAKVVGLFIAQVIAFLCALSIVLSVLTWFFGGGWIILLLIILVAMQI
jgi:hypothetical protein